MIYLISFLIILASALFLVSKRYEKALGLPGSKVIYSDTNQWISVREPLIDYSSGLTGKPDYLVRVGNVIIPIEVKSSLNMHRPYEAHIFQLAAYCRLVENTMHVKPPYGILHYTNTNSIIAYTEGHSYEIPFTSYINNKLDHILQEIHISLDRKTIHRSHNSRQRCQKCGFYHICDQKIQ